MVNQTFIPVILAGGKGERFWPLSRLQCPKQFLCLDGSGKSLLQSTADRLLNLSNGWQNLRVITSELLAEGVRHQLPSLPIENILVEPMGKDTAPAVTWASLEIQKLYGDDAIAGFFPADHYIRDQGQFEKIIEKAIDYVTNHARIVTLGITPEYPSTGFGYIEGGDKQREDEGISIYKVNRFTEKPDKETAEKFIATGKYSWNSGMFIFPVGLVLQELSKYASEMVTSLKEKGKSAYGELEKISIDYALMEKTTLTSVIPAEFGWDDLGDWNALERLLEKEKTNVIVGNVVSENTHDSIIYNHQKEEIIMTVGIDDVVIVREGNATLVVNKHKTQDIKKALKLLQNRQDKDNFL